jgi:hypothetical protein
MVVKCSAKASAIALAKEPGEILVEGFIEEISASAAIMVSWRIVGL